MFEKISVKEFIYLAQKWFIGRDDYFKFSSGKVSYLLLSPKVLEKFRDKGYDFAIIIKFTKDDFLAPTIKRKIEHFLFKSKVIDDSIINKMGIKKIDIKTYLKSSERE